MWISLSRLNIEALLQRREVTQDAIGLRQKPIFISL